MPETQATFARDGVVCVRRVVSAEWLGRLEQAVEDLMIRTDRAGRDLAAGFGDTGAFYSEIQVWKHSSTVRAFLESSGIAAVAARVMGARNIRLLSDQLLVKEPGTSAITPWHQDSPYFPCSGDQMCSVWIGVDPVTAETGAMSFVTGSHRSGRQYQPVDFERGLPWGDLAPDGPAPDGWAENLPTVCHAMAPGDVTVHHARTLHAARGNRSPTLRRRGYTVRLAGDDVRWEGSAARGAGFPAFEAGAPLRGPEHPLLWSSEPRLI